jgi:tetratricopeptide (TPR) repeat protein
LGLALLVAVLYARTARFESLDFDDQEYVYANPNVLGGITGQSVAWALTAFHSANWHPLTWISHMIDVELFGPEPGPHHLVNAALHAINSVLLFFVLRAATSAFWPSAIVATLFVVHPLNVESVAWISQRKSVLSTLFLILAMGASTRWSQGRRPRFAVLAALFLALGLLCKPMLVTAPLLFLLLDFWPLSRRGGGGTIRGLVLEKVPLFALAAAAAAATLLAQAKWNAVAPAANFPIGARLSNALISLVAYLRDAIWPMRLAAFYPHPASMGETIGLPAAAGAAAILLAITGLALGLRRTHPWLLFGWAWYVVALLPVIGFVQVGSQARADRYTYVPMIGIFAAIVWEIAVLAEARRFARRVAAALAILVVGFLSAVAFAQVGTWRDAEHLYTRALRVTRNNWLATNNLGNVWLERGDLQRALQAFRDAEHIKPDYEMAYYNEGVALMRLSRPADALLAYRENLRLDPSNTDGWINLGYVLLQLGRVPEGLRAYETALSQRGDDPLGLYGAAAARAALGDQRGAVVYLGRLERVDPAWASELRQALASTR